MNVIREFENSLLKRKEVFVREEYEKNPGIQKVTEDVAKKFGAEKDLVVIKKIGSEFGKRVFEVEAFVYNSVEDKEKIEPKPKEKK